MVCSKVCKDDDWNESTTQKGPSFGVCQVKSQAKQRPPTQSATHQNTVLGEDQLHVPWENLRGYRTLGLCSFLPGSPIELLYLNRSCAKRAAL